MSDTHTNYDEVEEYLSRFADVDDGQPNEAMRCLRAVEAMREKARELAVKNQRLENIAKFAHAALIPSGSTGEFYREELMRIRNIASIGKQ